MTFQDDQLSPGYNQFDEERFVTELPKRHGRRAFARDKARVLHSAGLRRLAAKTQMMSAGADDFPRTRLTHTLEVAQIGRELGEALGCDPDLVETACLVHDLGHPPFGHNGEEALHKASLDIGGFEGNAQTFRLLTRLESKTIRDGRSLGLNLTRATLDAATKYPWEFDGKNPKFGYYQEDKEIFDWVRLEVKSQGKVFEAQVMDIADDIAYSVHDIEDAIYGQHFSPLALDSEPEFKEVVKLAAKEYASEIDESILSKALNSLINQSWWVKSFTATQVDMASLKNMTSHLIGKFTEEIEQATKSGNKENNLTRYNANLIVPLDTKAQIAVLKSVVNLFVMQRKGAAENYAKEQDLILSIVDGLQNNPLKLDPQFKQQYDNAESSKEAKRAVIDQVASLTDSSARRLAQEFVG
ncbi:MAG: deoxyguanosinetriphosphate triphosphohydrolase [Candidatus Nanopelagicales bacterium]|nr:deoxyguanosinetriphosphate triphosphohydrolase [Candidatus Nanopelagicales bacterium]